jgi:hypothetical protein
VRTADATTGTVIVARVSVALRGLPRWTTVIVTSEPGGPLMSDVEYSDGLPFSDVLPTATIRSPA